MYIDQRYYVDPINNWVTFLNPTGGNLVRLGVKAVSVTNQLGGNAIETCFATDDEGMTRAFELVQRAFPGVPLKWLDNATAKQISYHNIGRLNFNLSTSAAWIVMNNLAIVHPLAVLIRDFEERTQGKSLRDQMRDALEFSGFINQVIP